MIELLLAGRHDAPRPPPRAARSARDRRSLPAFTLTDLDGRPVSRARTSPGAPCSSSSGPPGARPAAGRWAGSASCSGATATGWWCWPWRSSPTRPTSAGSASEAGVAAALGDGHARVARAFGDVSAMPTLLLFDGQGRPGRVVLRRPAGASRRGRGEALEPLLNRLAAAVLGPLRPGVQSARHLAISLLLRPARGRNGRLHERQGVQAVRPRGLHDGGVHGPGAGPGPRDERRPRRRQRVPRPARGDDDRRHLPGRGHRHGRAADDEGLAPRGELREDRRLDRRVGGGRRDLHDPRVRGPPDVELPDASS